VHHGVGVLVLGNAGEDEETQLQISNARFVLIVLHHDGTVLKYGHQQIGGILRNVNDGCIR